MSPRINDRFEARYQVKGDIKDDDEGMTGVCQNIVLSLSMTIMGDIACNCCTCSDL